MSSGARERSRRPGDEADVTTLGLLRNAQGTLYLPRPNFARSIPVAAACYGASALLLPLGLLFWHGNGPTGLFVWSLAFALLGLSAQLYAHTVRVHYRIAVPDREFQRLLSVRCFGWRRTFSVGLIRFDDIEGLGLQCIRTPGVAPALGLARLSYIPTLFLRNGREIRFPRLIEHEALEAETAVLARLARQLNLAHIYSEPGQAIVVRPGPAGRGRLSLRSVWTYPRLALVLFLAGGGLGLVGSITAVIGLPLSIWELLQALSEIWRSIGAGLLL